MKQYTDEKYLANKEIINDEPDPFALTKVESIWNGEGDNLYKKMVNNFLGETVNFFLEDSELSFIASKTQKILLSETWNLANME